MPTLEEEIREATEFVALPPVASPSPSHVTPEVVAQTQPPVACREGRAVAIRAGKFSVLLGLLWLAFYGLYQAFPYVRPGVDLIYRAKADYSSSHELFPKHAANRVLIFGNSMVLSGFVPQQFDDLSGGKVESYNMGMPGESWFMDALRRTLEAGNRPTHVICTLAWMPDAPKKGGVFDFIEDDTKFLAEAFPFRTMPRDVVLFWLRSGAHGGVKAGYDYARESVQVMLRDRGYYFIEGQSHYANNAIPDDVTFDGDTPDKPQPRELKPEGREFQGLLALADQYKFEVYMAPVYSRMHLASEAPATNEAAEAVVKAYPRLHLAGPDYWRYPNRMFSDRIHANPDGAKQYTRDMYELMAPTFKAAAN